MKRTDGTPYIIAEVGGNHEGCFDEAKKLLELAISSGADAIKFQIYTGESLVNKLEDPNRVAHFDKFSLSLVQYHQLADICDTANVDFLASVWSEDLCDGFISRMPFVKIGSGDLTAYPLLKKIAASGKPILLSTGLSHMLEVKSAVNFIRKINSVYFGKDMLGIMQCTSMYPIPDNEANLLVLRSIRKEFPEVILGYSDHTVGCDAIELAYILGAQVIEVHFTNKREGRQFRDHQVSLTSKEILEYKRKCSVIQELLGSREKKPTKSEHDSGHIVSFRRALYYKADLPSGTIISESHITALRPANGLPADSFESLIGKKLSRHVLALSRISVDDFS